MISEMEYQAWVKLGYWKCMKCDKELKYDQEGFGTKAGLSHFLSLPRSRGYCMNCLVVTEHRLIMKDPNDDTQ